MLNIFHVFSQFLDMLQSMQNGIKAENWNHLFWEVSLAEHRHLLEARTLRLFIGFLAKSLLVVGIVIGPQASSRIKTWRLYINFECSTFA